MLEMAAIFCALWVVTAMQFPFNTADGDNISTFISPQSHIFRSIAVVL